MKLVPILASVALLLVAPPVIAGQTPSTGSAPTYLLIDKENMGPLRELLVQAGADGFGAQLWARPSSSHAVLLKRDGLGPRTYKLVAPTRESTFLKELNEAGEQGFKLLPGFVKHSDNHWIGLLERQVNGARFTYSFINGDEKGTKALAEAQLRGATLVAYVGSGLFVLEEPQAIRTSEGGAHEFVVVYTGKTSTLETEIQEHAALGFRVLRAGFMSVLMERDPTATPASVEYRLVAMIRVETAERELKEAGAEGFRIAVAPEHQTQGVSILERTGASTQRFDYALVRLSPQTADSWLARAEATGYRMVVLFDRIAVFERAIP